MTVNLNSISGFMSLKTGQLSRNARYEIYNDNGRLIQIGSISSKNQALNVNQIGKSYTLRIINGEEVIEENIFK